MRNIGNNQYVYKFDELMGSYKKNARNQIETELYYLAIKKIDFNKHMDDRIKQLEQKGFSNIAFYRLYVEDIKIVIDFTFEYKIDNWNFDNFVAFTSSIGFSNSIDLLKQIMLEDMILHFKLEKREKPEHSNPVKVEKIEFTPNIDNNAYLQRLEKLFNTYYDFFIEKMANKIKKEINMYTEPEEYAKLRDESEFYFNGLLFTG